MAALGGDATRRRLDLVGRTPEAHAALLATAALAGFVTPLVLAAIVTWTSATVATWMVSLGFALGLAAVGVLLVVADLEQRAAAASRDLRHQLSAYLDVLTMLLASNQGNEGALRLAADAGDGRLFVELRRRMLEAATAGRPAVTALAALGRDLGVVELIEIAASASLATSQGAPVARSLVAKTESLRSCPPSRTGTGRPRAHREDHLPARRHGDRVHHPRPLPGSRVHPEYLKGSTPPAHQGEEDEPRCHCHVDLRPMLLGEGP